MMRLLFVIIAISLFISACGVKDKPEYQSQVHYNKNIHKF
jgi:hypothetical protein